MDPHNPESEVSAEACRKLTACISAWQECQNPKNKIKVRYVDNAVEMLKECLENREILHVLDSNSNNKRKQSTNITWQEWFHICHTMILALDSEAIEEERMKIATTKPKLITREACLNAVGLVAKKANRDPKNPHLKLATTIRTCLDVLKQDRWIKVNRNYGALYLNILLKTILQHRIYWSQLTAAQWQELAEYCMDFYVHYDIGERNTLIMILEIVVKQGNVYAPVAITLKSRLNFFGSMFNVSDLNRHVDLEESLLRLCNTVVKVLALECRMALCKLGEEVFDTVIKIRKARTENEKRMTLILDFLQLQMSLHHPGGVRESEGAYAHNWEVWRRQLWSLHSLLQKEIQSACQPRNLRSKIRGMNVELSPALVTLTVLVYRQIFSMKNIEEIPDVSLDSSSVTEIGTKRRKLDIGVSALIDELKTAKASEEISTRLRVVSQLLQTYPTMFEPAQYLALMQVLAHIQSSCKNNTVMLHLYRCCNSLLMTESRICLIDSDVAVINGLWEKIWDFTLRGAGLNQCVEGCHSLLQALLSSSHCHPARYSSLLQLLMSGTVHLTLSSVLTLNTLAEKCHLPSIQEKVHNGGLDAPYHSLEETVCLWDTLLRWLLPSRSTEEVTTTEIPANILAETIVRLCLKTRIQPAGETKVLDDSPYKFQKKIEAMYQPTVLEIGITAAAKQNVHPVHDIQANSIQLNTKAVDNMLQLLLNEFNYIQEKFKNERNISKLTDKVSTANMITRHIMLLAEILSYMLKWQMITENDFPDHELVKYLKLSNQMLPEALGRVLQVAQHSAARHHLDVLNNLKRLYSVSVHKSVSEILRNSVTSEIFSLVEPIAMKIRSTNSKYVDDMMDTNDVTTDSQTSFKERHSPKSIFTPQVNSFFNPALLHLNTKEESSLFHENYKTEDMKQSAATKVLSRLLFPTDEDGLTSHDTELALTLLKFAFDLCSNMKNSKEGHENELDFSKVTPTNIQRIAHIILAASLSSSLSRDEIIVILEILKFFAQQMSRDPEIVVVVLSVLTNMIVHIYNDKNESLRKIAIQIISGFTKIMKKCVFGVSVRIALISCLRKIAEVDPEQTWFCKQGEDGSIPIVVDILEYLKDPYNEARLAAAPCIKTLFCSNTPGWDLNQTQKWHKSVFEQMSKIVTLSFDNVAAGSVDELPNLTSSALQSMGIVIVSSPLWRKKALFGIIQQAKFHKMDIKPLKNMLEIVGRELAVPSVKQFLGANLRFILTQWMRLYKLQEFPWSLLESNSETEFLTTFQEIIIPILMQYKNTEALNYLAEKLHKSVPEAVEQCYPQIISCILPFLDNDLDKGSLDIRSRDNQLAKTLHEEITKILGFEKLDELLVENIGKIIVCLFNMLHDVTKWRDNIGIPLEITAPDIPYYDLDHVEYTLKYIQSLCAEPDTPLLVHLANASPSLIQTILQQLTVSIHDAPTDEDRLIAFLQYAAFTKKLSSHLEGDSLGTATAFIVRDIIHMLLNLLKKSRNENALSIAVCISLQDISSKCISNCLQYFEHLLQKITNTLILTIKQHKTGPVVINAMKVLEFLVVDNRYKLQEFIKKLGPFPQDDTFKKIQHAYHEVKHGMNDYDIEDEIAHFLNAAQADGGNRVEGLIFIRSQLASKKSELKRLYDDLHSLRGFSEDCASSLLHQLICVLVKLTSSTDRDVALEAAKCLGELGPSDLSSLVLQPEASTTSQEGSTPEVALCTKKIELLKEYLVDSDRCVGAAAAAALYSLLETTEGNKALKNIQDHEYLEPFKATEEIEPAPLMVDENKFVEKLGGNEIWCPSLPCNHQVWITDLVCAILESISYNPIYLEHLIAVCRTKETFSVELLPYLLNFILNGENGVCRELVANKMNLFFMKHYEMRDKQFSKTRNKLICFNKTSVRCMLNVVQFTRTQEHTKKVQCKLNLNFLHVAQAAKFCSAYFTSLFYAELWGHERKISKDNGFHSIDEICDDSDDGKALHEILFQGYKQIGDSDALHGCGMSRLLDAQSRMWYFEHCAKWNKVMLMQDVGLGQPKGVLTKGMATALQQSGLHNLLLNTLRSQETEETRAMQYECCWRLSQWDLPTAVEAGREQPSWNVNASAAYEAHHYSALKSLYSSDVTSLGLDLQSARNCINQSLSHVSLESSKNIYGALSQLQMLQEIEDLSQAIVQIPGVEHEANHTLQEVLEKWKKHDEITYNKFQYSEPILSQRIALLGIACERHDSQDVLHAELHNGSLLYATSELLLQLAATARKEQYFSVAEKALLRFSEQQGIPTEFMLRWKLEDAQNLWDQGNKEMGRHLLLSVISSLEQNQRDLDDHSTAKLQATSLTLYGSWLVDTRSENVHVIINNYFLKAIEILQTSINSTGELVEAYKSLARFADIEYQRVDKYMKSPSFLSKQDCMEKSKQTARTLRASESQTKDLARAINVNEKQSKLDLLEINNVTEERQKYLELALEYYLLSLDAAVTEEESTVFRIVSLWLDNKNNLGRIKQALEIKFKTTASYKFLCVLPQLVPHITVDTKDDFNVILTSLLERLSLDHPHHTLPILLALAKMYSDCKYMKIEAPKSPEPRVVAAVNLIKKLRRTKIADIITQMEKISDALIELANYEPTQKSAIGAKNIPSSQSIHRVGKLHMVQVFTTNLPVNYSGNYQKIVGIHSYPNKFEFVGGINAPKKIVCVGTDGVKRIQLVKGLDDLHQDAVMQQVFTIMNKLLRRNKNTRERKLLVRTYKVVPLSQRSGLIEWCVNTEPIGMYLLNAHPKYNPSDFTPIACRSSMKQAMSESNKKKLEVYLRLCAKLRPVFHHFFTENFLLPGVWFERHVAYSRSVATNSMIGYILGLGDRHVQNILVDKKTAEVIHIDFGIAFEQGLVLNVPETVPFRLTRDIEDGLGISGIEGIFRKSCEKTMEVLRENQETILTILQVLLYDPLYVWAISPERNQNNRKGMKGARDTGTSEVEVNKIAERALLRLQQKLMGTEEGMATSVEGQVNRLLQQARDPENLSRVFFGWQPYL